jgi:probable rRNA maturation factor
MPSINFYAEAIDFNLPQPRKTKKWIKSVLVQEGVGLRELSFIFCSDRYLAEMNQTYLNHDTYTDIITFDNSEEEGWIEADIFISIDRVQENATGLSISFMEELHRVMIHGVLHLVGYRDKTKNEKSEMRKKEDACLSLADVPRETYE